MILTNVRILTFDGANRVIDSGSVEVLGDGTIGKVRVGQAVSPARAGAIDLHGRLLMPALINCHTHLYSMLVRGMSLSGRPPRKFPEILQKLWWRLDRALNEEDVFYSALVGLIDSAKNGVGTVIDHHSSPNACAGSLDLIERAYKEVGLRGATCFETTDRNGRAGAAAGVRENVRFMERAQIGAAFGLHAAFTLSDRTLAACAEANQSLRAPYHIHVAEDRCDAGAVRRLTKLGILNERTLAAHCVHASATERTMLGRRGVNVIHNPQSNANNRVGTADITDLARRGVPLGLGSDGYSPRMWDEFKSAALRDARTAYAAAFINNRAIVKKLWGYDIGHIEPGARADLLVADYFPPTPIRADNLFGHLLFGVSNAPINSLMVDGRWVVRERRCVKIDEHRVAEKATRLAKALWERF